VPAEGVSFERFVGRRNELEALIHAFHRVQAEHGGAAVLIAGEAGVGKTRLVSEFCKAVENTTCCTLLGAAVAYVQAPYGPVVEAFSENPSSRSEIERALLMRRPASGGGGDEDRAQRFFAVEQLLRKRASLRGAVVLVIEDFHWSDSATLDLFAYLVRHLRDVPVMLVGTYRAQDAEAEMRRTSAIARIAREGAQEIALGPLPDPDIVKAIKAAVPEDADLSQVEIERIRDLSDGRPFIAEELLRAAVVSARRGRPSDGGDVVTVRGAVLERVQAFDEADRLVLSYAAVIGREFDAKLLADIASSPLERIFSCLRQARRAQIVVENTDTGTFRFRHAVTQEVLRRELLIGEARALHGRIAEYFESEQGEERVSEIAYHWWAARRARPAFERQSTCGRSGGGDLCAWRRCGVL
jgi:predicted ATPase